MRQMVTKERSRRRGGHRRGAFLVACAGNRSRQNSIFKLMSGNTLVKNHSVAGSVEDHLRKRFSDPSNRRRHVLSHRRQNIFRCSVCGKGFRSRSGLRSHEEKHLEEKQAICALCGEPFGLLEDLEKHLKWHIHGDS
ncbi:unnamed protein product [Cyprideis torosa]|uniref:Uncharacterized protein n=1 Tax=Cyprideis torosa TaxID=163714 RepID=A0A7R8WRG1_9CRUS|nr:unnamed protein product [Cyprideis torosa]CAG0907469.1 unnamed protein product [Cyprideis torosa]